MLDRVKKLNKNKGFSIGKQLEQSENKKRSHLFILRPVELESDGPVQAAGVRRRVEGTGVARGEGDEGTERDRHVLLDDRHRVSRVDRLRSKSGRDRDFGVARVQDGGRERIDGLVLVDGRDVSGGGLGWGCLLYTSPSPRDS